MSLLSVENDIVKGLICNRELQKKDQVEKLSSKGQENFIAISKSWSNVKVPIKDKHSTWTLVPEQIKNLEKTFGKDYTICRIRFSTKWNTERCNEYNDRVRFQTWTLLRFLEFIATVVTMVLSFL